MQSTCHEVDSSHTFPIRISAQQAELAGLDLQREIRRIDAALREAAGDEPEARLCGAHEHVAQFLALAESPDRADAGRNILAEQLADQMLLPLVACREHNQVGRERLANAYARSRMHEGVDIGEL